MYGAYWMYCSSFKDAEYSSLAIAAMERIRELEVEVYPEDEPATDLRCDDCKSEFDCTIEVCACSCHQEEKCGAEYGRACDCFCQSYGFDPKKDVCTCFRHKSKEEKCKHHSVFREVGEGMGSFPANWQCSECMTYVPIAWIPRIEEPKEEKCDHEWNFRNPLPADCKKCGQVWDERFMKQLAYANGSYTRTEIDERIEALLELLSKELRCWDTCVCKETLKNLEDLRKRFLP